MTNQLANDSKLVQYVHALPGKHVVVQYGSMEFQLRGFEFLVESAWLDPGEAQFEIKPANQGPIALLAYTSIELYKSGTLIAQGGDKEKRPWAFRLEVIG